jgi:Sec-independent protein secretion pathway component TatC
VLIRYLKHAVLGCIALAAVITPTTEVANMLVIAGPMLLLYSLGIASPGQLVSRARLKRRPQRNDGNA